MDCKAVPCGTPHHKPRCYNIGFGSNQGRQRFLQNRRSTVIMNVYLQSGYLINPEGGFTPFPRLPQVAFLLLPFLNDALDFNTRHARNEIRSSMSQGSCKDGKLAVKSKRRVLCGRRCCCSNGEMMIFRFIIFATLKTL